MNLHCYPYYDPPEERYYCADCANYDRCECDRDYAEYLEAWSAAVECGEFDTTDFVAGDKIEMQEAA